MSEQTVGIGLYHDACDDINRLRAALAAAEARAVEVAEDHDGELHTYKVLLTDNEARADAAEERADRLAAALAFYADPESWQTRHITGWTDGHGNHQHSTGRSVDFDMGRKAREALAADMGEAQAAREGVI